MNNGYDPYSGWMGTFTKVVDTLILSMLWLVCCLPVVTIGAASSALYYAYHKAIRQDIGYACKTFFSAFRSNFKQATGIWLILLLFLVMSLGTCFLLFQMQKNLPMAGVFLTMGVFLIGFAVAWCLWLFPYLSRFENTLGIGAKNSALITFANLPWSLLLVVIFGAAVAIVAWKPAMCVPVIGVYIWLANSIIERIFRKLMTQEALQSEREFDRES